MAYALELLLENNSIVKSLVGAWEHPPARKGIQMAFRCLVRTQLSRKLLQPPRQSAASNQVAELVTRLDVVAV
jgi:hypothetical protein